MICWTAPAWKNRFWPRKSSASTRFSLLIPDMSHEEKQLLDDALIRTYAGKGITHDNATLDDPAHPGRYREMPILGDLYRILLESPDTKRLGNILNRLVNGSASAWNQQTNVSLDNKYTVLDISELTGDLLTVGCTWPLILYGIRPRRTALQKSHLCGRVLAVDWCQQQPAGCRVSPRAGKDHPRVRRQPCVRHPGSQ